MTRFVAIDRKSYDTCAMRLILTLTTFAALAFMAGPASAFDLEEALKQQHVQYQAPLELRASQGNGMSLSQAIESVRRRGDVEKVLSADTRVQGGREVHHIKVYTKNGTVRTIRVNGRRR